MLCDCEAFREAEAIFEEALVHFQGEPVGVPAALTSVEDEGTNYHEVFVRDFFVTAVFCLLSGKHDVVKNFLLTLARLQSMEKSHDCFEAGSGLMPASFKVDSEGEEETLKADFGGRAIGRVTPVDSGLWWLYLMRIYVKATGDESLIEKDEIKSSICAILDQYLNGYFELIPTLLVPDGAFMIDRRMGMYGHPLDIQVLFFVALRSAKELLEQDESEEIQEYRKRIQHRLEHLKHHMECFYWLSQKRLNDIYRYKTEQFGTEVSNRYNIYSGSIPGWVKEFVSEESGYFVGNLGPGRMDFRFLSTGNCLSVLGGLADQEKSRMLASLFRENRSRLIGEMPMKICYPALERKEWEIITGYDPKNAAWSYHNGGSWPFASWMLVAASLRTDACLIEADWMKAVIEKVRDQDWPEYYDGKSGNLVGKEARLKQLWTITGTLAACALFDQPEKASIFCFEYEEMELNCPYNGE